MASEWRVTMATCGLERGARRQILEVLAGRANEETGLVEVSMSTLAFDIRRDERTVRRVLADMVKTGDGLLTLVRKGNGRGRCSVYQINIPLLEPVSQAVRLAKTVILAGTATALLDRRLVGARVTRENIVAIFDALVDAVAAEGNKKTAAAIKAQRAVYEALAAHEEGCEQGCEGETQKADKMSSFSENGDRDLFDDEKGDISESKKEDISPIKGDTKGDILSKKEDILSIPPTPPYKDIHLETLKRARERARAGTRVPLLDLCPNSIAGLTRELLDQTTVIKTGDTLRFEDPSGFVRQKLASERPSLRRVAQTAGCSKFQVAEPLSGETDDEAA